MKYRTFGPPLHPNLTVAEILKEGFRLCCSPFVGVPCVSPNLQHNLAGAIEDKLMGNELVAKV
jgi:hypothetical protein